MTNLTQKISNKKGFTLMEILIAVSVFAVVITMSSSIYINITREHKRATIQNGIYEDARLMLEQIAAQVRKNEIDYEEYNSQLVEQKAVPVNNRIYGLNYGKYGSKFYDPGFTIQSGTKLQGVSPQDLGAECGDGTLVEDNPDCIVYIPSLDINTGKNPYTLQDISADTATAFCDGDCAGSPNINDQKELYLISQNGTRKVIFAKELINQTTEEYALSMIELKGEDTDSNGIVDEYTCDTEKGYICTDDKLPTSKDLSSTSDAPSSTEFFAPISSKDINVKDVQFIIAPIEDPRKGFNETTNKIKMQPHVTIILTVEPTETVRNQVSLQTIPSMTLQTTITPRVYNEVKSFPPCKSMENFKDPNKNCLGEAI